MRDSDHKREWSTEKTIIKGQVETVITSTPGDEGKLYTISFSKYRPNHEKTRSKFFYPQDLANIGAATVEAAAWIDSDVTANKNKD